MYSCTLAWAHKIELNIWGILARHPFCAGLAIIQHTNGPQLGFSEPTNPPRNPPTQAESKQTESINSALPAKRRNNPIEAADHQTNGPTPSVCSTHFVGYNHGCAWDNKESLTYECFSTIGDSRGVVSIWLPLKHLQSPQFEVLCWRAYPKSTQKEYPRHPPGSGPSFFSRLRARPRGSVGHSFRQHAAAIEVWPASNAGSKRSNIRLEPPVEYKRPILVGPLTHFRLIH